jgi:hypothetical protein
MARKILPCQDYIAKYNNGLDHAPSTRSNCWVLTTYYTTVRCPEALWVVTVSFSFSIDRDSFDIGMTNVIFKQSTRKNKSELLLSLRG